MEEFLRELFISHLVEVTHSALLIHLVWTTNRRTPMITARVAQFLVRYLPAVAHQEQASVLAIGAVSTHVHVLVSVSPSTGLSRLVQRFKGGSSRVAEIEGHAERLRWGKGYSASSVSQRNIPSVLEYLRSQAEHHPQEAIPDWSGYVSFLPSAEAEARLERTRTRG